MKRSHIALLVSGTALLTFAGYYFGAHKSINDDKVFGNNAATTTLTTTESTELGSSSVKELTNVAQGTVTKPAIKQTSNYAYIGKRTMVGAVAVTPIKVSYDSRCPKDVRCIQAGTIDVAVLLEEGKHSQSVILTLGKQFIFAEKTVTLTNVYPERVSTKTLKDSDYKFLFTVK